MRTAKVDRLSWVAIYVGMALFGLGVSITRGDDAAAVGWSVAAVGGLAVLFGIVGVWWRSRMGDDVP